MSVALGGSCNQVGGIHFEHGADRLPLLIREKVAISAPLLVSLMAHELVNDTLVDALGRKI